MYLVIMQAGKMVTDDITEREKVPELVNLFQEFKIYKPG